MSKSANLLNQEYTKICQQLGDSYLKLKQLNAVIEKLESEAARLNESYALLQNLETSLLADQTSTATTEQKLGMPNRQDPLDELNKL